MSNDLKDILSNSNKDINNQQLMDYLSNQLSKANEHEVEKAMADDGFINDAVEGLQQIGSNSNLQDYVEQLNNNLHKQIANSKSRKDKRRRKDPPNTYIAILLILLLLIVSFVLLKKYLDAKKVKEKNANSRVSIVKNNFKNNNTVFLHTNC